MHIVFVTPDFVNNCGPTTGLPKYLLRVSQTLIEWKHEVTIVCCSDRTVTYDFFGIRVYRVRKPSIVKYGDQKKDTIARFLCDANSVNEALHRINSSKHIDIIQYASLSGLAYFHDLPIPAVMRLSSYACMWPVPGKEEQQLSAAMMEREAAKKCDAIFGPSHVVADRFSKDIERKVDVIETPFVLETNQENAMVYNEFFEGKKYILFYGAIVEYKGLKVISEAVYDILNMNRDICIGIIGNGDKSLISNIKKKARNYSDRVIFHEAIGFSELLPIIKNAEAILLPSLMENFSNACVESMALEKIVIGTDGTSFEQLIEDGKSGLLCIPGDSNSLVYKINEALNLSVEDREEMQQYAKKRADFLKPETVVKQLIEYYEHIINVYNSKKDK